MRPTRTFPLLLIHPSVKLQQHDLDLFSKRGCERGTMAYNMTRIPWRWGAQFRCTAVSMNSGDPTNTKPKTARMKCLEAPEKQKQVEKELHKLLSQATFILPLCITCRSIGDTSSIITYIMVFLNQMPGDITTLRSTLKKETNVFLQSGSGILAS